MIRPGKTVRFRDGARRNHQALVVNVITDHDDQPPYLDLIYAIEGGTVEVRLVPHRSRVTTPGLKNPKDPNSGLDGPYPEHWL